MRSITLYVHEDDNFPHRLQVALDLVRGFDGHLSCIQAVAFDIVVPGDYYGAMTSEMVPVIREQAERLREKVSAELANEDVNWDWVEEIAMADNRLLAHASLSDLLVVGAEPDDGPAGRPSRLAGTLAIHAKTPVMIVPNSANSFDVDAPALVAWNGSPEASRALRAAMPLLKKAKSVYLAQVGQVADEDGADLPVTSGAEYLARHGIECEIVELPASGDVAKVLQSAAVAREAAYIVMGAYGHSRLREMVFGGVTRSMLTNPKLPLLLVH